MDMGEAALVASVSLKTMAQITCQIDPDEGLASIEQRSGFGRRHGFIRAMPNGRYGRILLKKPANDGSVGP
jgi:hypothetical protein